MFRIFEGKDSSLTKTDFYYPTNKLTEMQNNKYIGRIVTVPGREDYAFIGISTVSHEKEGYQDLGTADIFIHQDECSVELIVGTKVGFNVIPDLNRGEGFFRATGAIQHVEELELMPEGKPMEGFNALMPFGSSNGNLIVAATPAQNKMKDVDPEVVKTVLANQPASGVPRDSSVPPNVTDLLKEFLLFLFPAMEQFGSHFRIDANEDELQIQMNEAQVLHTDMGMLDQLVLLEEEFKKFLSFRKALMLMVQENLVRRDTIIPIEYLPDFFTAVPVWYLWADEAGVRDSDNAQISDDPQVHKSTDYFCDLFPNQNWADMFQMFNRRFRTLKMYKGDLIPPAVMRRMKEASQHFDYVVIMTPYHDVVGRDWQDAVWMRSIDPYVVGFKKGIPYFFILARFSDSGTFPLFAELIGDTVEFLRTNKSKLNGFNSTQNPYWHTAGGSHGSYRSGNGLGNHLKAVAQNALAAFDQGKLFDWLRGKVTDAELDN